MTTFGTEIMAEDDLASENLVAATLANGIMIAKGGTPTPIEAVALYFECLDALKVEHRTRYAPTA
jgi:hypothetical protein